MTLKRCCVRLGLLVALVGAVACGAVRRTDTPYTHANWSCATAKSEARKQLLRLDSRDARGPELATYSAVVDAMLIACDAEAKAMSATLADDWKIQSFLLRRDLARLERMSTAAVVEFLPSHRSRVERVMATFEAMYGNPPKDR